jgi:hypothetical protein
MSVRIKPLSRQDYDKNNGGIPVDIPNLTCPEDRYWPEIPDDDLNLMF